MRKYICLLALFLALMFTPTSHGQTTDCHHLTNDVAYWDNLRVALGNVTEIHGSDITLVAKGKDQVAVRVYHLTKNTVYAVRGPTTIHNVTSQILRDDQGGLWAVTYCYWCREIFAISKLEGL